MGDTKLRVGVLGAGAIGGYLGLRLAAGGASVILVGRRSLYEQRKDLTAVDLDGHTIPHGKGVVVTEDPAALSDADLVIVTVKARGNEEAGRLLAAHVPTSATVVSFQNGLHNASTLEQGRGAPVVPGMVSFNVVREHDGAWFRQATKGPLVAGTGEGADASRMRRLGAVAEAGGLALMLREDVRDVLAGKLLLNLNNGICAVTGLPIVASLTSPDARACLSQCMLEGLTTLRAEGYRPASVIGLPPWIIARALRLPNAILLRIAKRLVSADPSARSSTLQDLDAGKPTEIDELNGAIVALGQRQGVPCPANTTVVEIVRELERASSPLPHVDPAELRARIGAVSPT